MTTPQLQQLIVGVGSPHGDDQAGWLVAERLAGQLASAGVSVRRARSPAELLDWLDQLERLIICDASRGLGRAGEVRRWTWPDAQLDSATWSGTHDLALPTVLELAGRLGRLPPQVLVWSVEAAETGALAACSPAVAAVLPRLTDEIAREVNEVTRCTNAHS